MWHLLIQFILLENQKWLSHSTRASLSFTVSLCAFLSTNPSHCRLLLATRLPSRTAGYLSCFVFFLFKFNFLFSSTHPTNLASVLCRTVLLSQEVRALNEEISAEESRYHYITMMRSILEKQLEQVNSEMKLYVSTNTADKKKSLR